MEDSKTRLRSWNSCAFDGKDVRSTQGWSSLFRPLCVDCGQWNMDMDLENMNFLQMQEPVETHGWEMVIMGMVSVLDRDRGGL